jgi:hypothetical protein
MPNQNRKQPLRQEENPPYPEFAVEMVREFTKAISEQISPMREDVGVMKHTMGDLESQLRTHGQKLEDIVGIKHGISALEKESIEQGGKIETIDGHISTVKAILWVLGALAVILSSVSIILDFVKH